LAIDPHDIKALGHKGAALDNLGNYTGAMEYYDKALAGNPKYVFALDGKGTTLVKSGRYNEAIIVLNRALTIIQRMF
jgi:tetratricopeptide (TPR) repeat protein